MRFTKKNRQQVLDNNEGFTARTSFEGRNFRESRDYIISDGKLRVKVSGKTSWADSRYGNEYVYGADDEETKRFLRKYKDDLELEEKQIDRLGKLIFRGRIRKRRKRTE